MENALVIIGIIFLAVIIGWTVFIQLPTSSINNLQSEKPKPTLVSEEEQAIIEILNELCSDLVKETDINKQIEKYAAISKIITENQNKFTELRGRVYYYIRQNFKITKIHEIDGLSNFLAYCNDPYQQEGIYYILATSPLILGEPVVAYNNLQILEKKFPKSLAFSFLSKEDREKVVRAGKEYPDIIAITNEEERLWKLGELFNDTHCVSWNVGEVMYKLDYAHSFFQKLLEKYPNSKWADNAEYMLYEYDEAAGHEDGLYSIECVSFYQKFINKYPTSELIVNAKVAMGDHYFMAVEDISGLHTLGWLNRQTLQFYLTQARSYYQETLNKYPLYPHIEEIKNKLKQIVYYEDVYSWSLVIESNHTSYKPDEKVVIRFKFINNHNNERELELFKQPRNFALSINYFESSNSTSSNGEVSFIKEQQVYFNQSRKKVMIPKNGYYSEEQVLQNASVKWDFGQTQMGRFIISKEGLYKVRAFYTFNIDGQIINYSDEISFTIKKT